MLLETYIIVSRKKMVKLEDKQGYAQREPYDKVMKKSDRTTYGEM